MRFIVLIVGQRLYLVERTQRKEETVLIGSGTQLTPTDHTAALQPHPDETRRDETGASGREEREKESGKKGRVCLKTIEIKSLKVTLVLPLFFSFLFPQIYQSSGGAG